MAKLISNNDETLVRNEREAALAVSPAAEVVRGVDVKTRQALALDVLDGLARKYAGQSDGPWLRDELHVR
jgi:hypothetical protein